MGRLEADRSVFVWSELGAAPCVPLQHKNRFWSAETVRQEHLVVEIRRPRRDVGC